MTDYMSMTVAQFAEEYARREGTSYMEDLFIHDTGQELLDILDLERSSGQSYLISIGLALKKAEQSFRESIIADWVADDGFEDDEAFDVETRGDIRPAKQLDWKGEAA